MNRSRKRMPSDRSREIYRRHVALGETQAAIAADLGVSRQRINAICTQVSEWIADRYTWELQTIRVEHSVLLQGIFEEAVQAWRKTRNPRHVETARKSLADIRHIWRLELAANVPVQSVPSETELIVRCMNAMSNMPADELERLAADARQREQLASERAKVSGADANARLAT